MKAIIIAMVLWIVADHSHARKTTPEEINGYVEKAKQAAVVVISQADDLKAYKASPEYKDIWTSAGALQAYEDRLTTYANTLRAVQDGLLTTATELLTLSQYEIQAAKQGMKYRDTGY